MHLTSGAVRRDGDPWNGDPLRGPQTSRTGPHVRTTPSRAGTARTGSRRGRRGGTDVDAANGRRDERVVVSRQRPSGHLDVGHRASASGLTCARTCPETIVVGYDGSSPSERAVERAATLAGAHGMVVVTASPSQLPPGVTSEPILDAPPPEEQNAMLERSRALLQEHGTRRRSSRRTGPAEALIQAARDQRAELIVVGHTGSGTCASAARFDRRERGAPRVRRVGGSVARQMLTRPLRPRARARRANEPRRCALGVCESG